MPRFSGGGGGGYWKQNVGFDFLYNFFEKFFILNRIERDIINVHWSSSYSSHILVKLEFSRQIFEESSNIEFHENPSSDTRVVP
jgi:hypothetical protein